MRRFLMPPGLHRFMDHLDRSAPGVYDQEMDLQINLRDHVFIKNSSVFVRRTHEPHVHARQTTDGSTAQHNQAYNIHTVT